MGSFYGRHRMPVIIAAAGALLLLMITVTACVIVKKRKMARYQFRHRRFENMDNFKKNLVLSTEGDLPIDSEKSKVMLGPEVVVTPELEQKVTLA